MKSLAIRNLPIIIIVSLDPSCPDLWAQGTSVREAARLLNLKGARPGIHCLCYEASADACVDCDELRHTERGPIFRAILTRTSVTIQSREAVCTSRESR